MPLDLSGKGFAVRKSKESNSVTTSIQEDSVDTATDIQESPNSPWMTVSPKYKMSDLILDAPTREALLDAKCFK